MNDPRRPDAAPSGSPSPERPAVPRPDGSVMTEHSSGRPPSAPRPPAPPPTIRSPLPPKEVGPDPEVGIDTAELSLAELREAARREAALWGAGAPTPPEVSAELEAGVATGAPAPAAAESAPAGVETADVDLVDVEIDLVEAERQEATEAAPAPPGVTDPDAVADLAPLVDADATGDLAADGSIDPRIRERRVAVTRAEGRRRLRILLTVVTVASVIGIAWLVVQSPMLAVNTIKVQGTARESQAAVQSAAGVGKGSALLFVDTGAVARRVEALPWVAQAKVERDFPNDLQITVIERSPVAWVRHRAPPGSPEGTLGAIALVDRFGRVLGPEAQPPALLPEIIGVSRVPERGGRIEPAAPAAALGQLPDALRAQTGSLIRRRSEFVLKLVALPGGAPPAAGEVRLGSLDEVAPKGAAALAVLDQLTAGHQHVGYIDVRVPGAPATR